MGVGLVENYLDKTFRGLTLMGILSTDICIYVYFLSELFSPLYYRNNNTCSLQIRQKKKI